MMLRYLYARTHVSPHSNFETAPVVEPVVSRSVGDVQMTPCGIGEAVWLGNSRE
jgi:hypothetical protein